MPHVNYTAKHEIETGHIVDTSYDLFFEAQTISPGPKRDVQKSLKISLGGQKKTIAYRTDKLRSISTVPFPESEYVNGFYREFLASVENGESFTLDAYRHDAADAVKDPQVVIMDGSPSVEREGDSLFVVVSFDVIHA